MDDKPFNNHECVYAGYKLSNIVTDIRAVNTNPQEDVLIGEGAEDGDFDPYRVVVSAFPEKGSTIELDLEDILKFSARYCPELLDRVVREASSG